MAVGVDAHNFNTMALLNPVIESPGVLDGRQKYSLTRTMPVSLSKLGQANAAFLGLKQ